MSKISNDEKYLRVVKFLMSFRDSRIALLMAARGFNEEDRAEGWALLEKATGRHMELPTGKTSSTSASNKLLAQIDGWENTWFDVADAALKRQFPEVHAKLFLNLSKANSIQVLITVKTFLNRLEAMEKEGGPAHTGAMALLEKRGLTRAQRNQAQAWLDEATKGKIIEQYPTTDSQTIAEQEQARQAMWAWYQDWANTARTVVNNKSLRIVMGISQPTSRRSSSENNTNTDADATTDTSTDD